MTKSSFVYILTNKARGTLYIGVTNDLSRRIAEHKLGVIPGFSKRYKLIRLVYFEVHESIIRSIEREKQLKRWHRTWKINLIESVNAEWIDLSKQGLLS